MTALDSATIPTTYSKMIALELGLNERTLNALLTGTTLKANDLTSESKHISATEQIDIIRNAFRLSGHEALGLHVGSRLTPPVHGALGFLANSSPDLLRALQAFAKFLPTRMSFLHMKVSEGTDYLNCQLDIQLNAEVKVHRFMMEAACLSLLSTIECVLGTPFTEGKLAFDFPEPTYSNLYKAHINSPIHFGSTSTLISIPLSLIYRPNVSADHENYKLALSLCQSLITKLPVNAPTTTHKVNTWLLSRPPSQFSEERAAASLFITKRTLTRRLTRENTSYRSLKEKILKDLATQYLEESSASIEAIAAMLDYHDSSSFRRAFRRWTGSTPAKYRDELYRQNA